MTKFKRVKLTLLNLGKRKRRVLSLSLSLSLFFPFAASLSRTSPYSHETQATDYGQMYPLPTTKKASYMEVYIFVI